MDMLQALTQKILDKDMDYEVTLKGSTVSVRLLDRMTENTIGYAEKGSLEEALVEILCTVASRAPQHFDGLSRL